MGFGENLKQQLESRNLKQVDLCRMTGIQTSLMSEYLGGKKNPTLGNAALIADALRIPLDVLVHGTDAQERTRTAAELCEQVSTLSESEKLFLLDIISSIKRRLGHGDHHAG